MTRKAITENVFNELRDAFPEKVITELKPFEAFYEAELEHQDYYANNSNAPYCQAVINPKLKKLRDKFQSKLKSAIAT